jgi:isochorismate synthase
LTTLQLFLNDLQEAYDSNKPFVAFRNPNERSVISLFQKDDEIHYVKEFSEEGFVFAPFDSKEMALLIVPDEKSELQLPDSFFSENKMTSDAFSEADGAREKHLNLVASAVEFLEEEDISKVVVARKKKVNTVVDFIKIFETLLRKYTAAYVYVWFHPKVGMWLGASPEILLKVEDGSFQTMSLAGTQKYKDTTDVLWGSKELEEQQMVTDYVLSNLEGVTASLKFSDVKTIKAGNLLHLKTDIEGRVAEGASLKTIIQTLHPTPAVCGFPKETAKEFILKNEHFDRKYYTGFLGELNINKETNLFVNLRCMEVVGENTVNIYVGGGITAKSDPEKEWEETVAKAKTMEASFSA